MGSWLLRRVGLTLLESALRGTSGLRAMPSARFVQDVLAERGYATLLLTRSVLSRVCGGWSVAGRWPRIRSGN